jgi:hypothetical protein
VQGPRSTNDAAVLMSHRVVAKEAYSLTRTMEILESDFNGRKSVPLPIKAKP